MVQIAVVDDSEEDGSCEASQSSRVSAFIISLHKPGTVHRRLA